MTERKSQRDPWWVPIFSKSKSEADKNRRSIILHLFERTLSSFEIRSQNTSFSLHTRYPSDYSGTAQYFIGIFSEIGEILGNRSSQNGQGIVLLTIESKVSWGKLLGQLEVTETNVFLICKNWSLGGIGEVFFVMVLLNKEKLAGVPSQLLPFTHLMTGVFKIIICGIL